MIIGIVKRIIASSLFKASGIYTVAGFLNAAIPLFLLPFLTNRLSPADYGIISMFQLAVSLVYPFVGMNLEGAIGRKYYDKDNENFPRYIGTTFVIVALNFFLVTLSFYFFFTKIQHTLDIPEDWVKYVVLVAASQFTISVLLAYYQVSLQSAKYGIFQIVQSLTNVLTTLYFVVYGGKAWEGRLKSIIITIGAFSFISLFLLLKDKMIKIEVYKRDFTHALRFGIPLIPHALGGMLFTAIDRFYLTNLLGLTETGNYTVAYQLGALINLITLAFNNAYTPWLYKSLNDGSIQLKKKIVKMTYLYFLFIALLALAVFFIFPSIVSVFIGKSFQSINSFSFFILCGFAFQGMYYMVTNYIGYVQKTYLLAVVTLSVAIIKFPITYFSITQFGAKGASISYCLTFFIYFIATWALSARVFKMPWVSFYKPD